MTSEVNNMFSNLISSPAGVVVGGIMADVY